MAAALRFRTISRTTIPAAAAENFPLNALDHAMAEGLAEVVYFYRHTLDPVLLQQSLRRTLQDFPLLCGQLRSEPDGTLSIGYPHPGVPFTVSECNLPLAEITSGLHEAYTVYDFIDKINPLLLKRKNRPLATFRLTRMNGGGSALGISCAHAAADGYSFYYFINRWSQVHEGLPVSRPWHERSVLSFDAAAAPAHRSALPGTCNGFRLFSSWQLLKLALTFLARRNSMVCRVLRFTLPQLTAIKDAAGQQGPVSVNDALSAHLWQFCTKLQNAADHSAPRRLLFGAGMRSKIDHPLSRHYFGNLISNAVVACSAGELTGGAIASIAGACRQSVAALDNDYLKEQMRWLGQQEKNKQMLRVFADVNPYAGDCVISSLFKLPVYEASFNGHKPFWAGVPAVQIPWVLYFIPAPGENGGIDVYANLPRSAAAKLRQDEWQAELYKYGTLDNPAVAGEPGAGEVSA